MTNLLRKFFAGAAGLTAMSFGATALADARYDHARSDAYYGYAQQYYDDYPERKGYYGKTGYVEFHYSKPHLAVQVSHKKRHSKGHKKKARPHHYKSRQRRIVRRETFPTRYRAHISLTEYYVGHGRSARLICDVYAVGRDARYVSRKRLNRVAARNCSRRARIVT